MYLYHVVPAKIFRMREFLLIHVVVSLASFMSEGYSGGSYHIYSLETLYSRLLRQNYVHPADYPEQIVLQGDYQST